MVLLVLLVLLDNLEVVDNKDPHISREEVSNREEVREIEETIDARMVVGPDKEEQDGRIDKVTNKEAVRSKDLRHRQEHIVLEDLAVLVDLVAEAVVLVVVDLAVVVDLVALVALLVTMELAVLKVF
jgi:hypothetical protein